MIKQKIDYFSAHKLSRLYIQIQLVDRLSLFQLHFVSDLFLKLITVAL